MSEIKVSICMLTFNHEKYVRKAIDSVISQKTNFEFELLINDDASTDNTQSIIKEYEEKYPDIVKPLYHDVNQHNLGVRNSMTFNYPRVSGKYCAILEGDDYYTDDNKLQEQYDIMESNPNCSICVHKVGIKNEDLTQNTGIYPEDELKSGIFTSDEVIDLYLKKCKYVFHTSSYFIKSSVLKSMIADLPKFISCAPVGDFPWMLFYAINGDLYYIDKEMSVYRRGSDGSWTNRHKSKKNKIKYYTNMLKMLTNFDEYTNFKYKDSSKYIIEYFNFSLDFENRKFFKIRKQYPQRYNDLKTKTKFKLLLYSIFPFVEKIAEGK